MSKLSEKIKEEIAALIPPTISSSPWASSP
jgi:hypothetical protein